MAEKKKLRRPTTDQIAAIVADYHTGMTTVAVARKHGVAHSTVGRYVQKAHGISRKRYRAAMADDVSYAGADDFDPAAWEVRNGILHPLFPERRSA